MLCNFLEMILRYGCSVNLLHIFRTLFPENTSGGLLLSFWNRSKMKKVRYLKSKRTTWNILVSVLRHHERLLLTAASSREINRLFWCRLADSSKKGKKLIFVLGWVQSGNQEIVCTHKMTPKAARRVRSVFPGYEQRLRPVLSIMTLILNLTC